MSEFIKNDNPVPNDEYLKWQNMAPPDHGKRDWFSAKVPDLTKPSEASRDQFDAKVPKLSKSPEVSQNRYSSILLTLETGSPKDDYHEASRKERSKEEAEADIARINAMLDRAHEQRAAKKKIPDEGFESFLDRAMDAAWGSATEYYGDQTARRAEYEGAMAANKTQYDRARQEVKRAEDEMDAFIYGGKRPEFVAQSKIEASSGYPAVSPAKKKILSRLFSKG